MTDRIKELANECWDPPEGGTFSLPVFNYRKFAELILHECDNVFESNFYGDPHDIYYYIEDIKTHFGIETCETSSSSQTPTSDTSTSSSS